MRCQHESASNIKATGENNSLLHNCHLQMTAYRLLLFWMRARGKESIYIQCFVFNPQRKKTSTAVDLVTMWSAESDVLSHVGVKRFTREQQTCFPFLCSCLCVFRREGEGVRIYWDRLREPSFTSRWNPFATDYPFITFTHHPVRNVGDTFATVCDVGLSVGVQPLTVHSVYRKSSARKGNRIFILGIPTSVPHKPHCLLHSLGLFPVKVMKVVS